VKAFHPSTANSTCISASKTHSGAVTSLPLSPTAHRQFLLQSVFDKLAAVFAFSFLHLARRISTPPSRHFNSNPLTVSTLTISPFQP
jgi:hypothetical protein